MAEHREFHLPDLFEGWERPEGYPIGISRKILSGALDETARTGRRTSLVRFAPGAILPRAVEHEFAEEVYVVEGDLLVGCAPGGSGGERFGAGTYAIRPARAPHGPFASETGCLMLEIVYFEDG
ncbi:MAG: cupin domain-containing protein [Acetobacterales bacterium]